MKDNPLVTILINNYNYGDFLAEAIDSALAQTYAHCEVIVVDDGSTDNSREIIESYGDRIIPILKQNGGQASAFNAGFATSKGDIICFLDSDDIFLPEKVAEIVNEFACHQDIGWCFHPLQFVNTTLEPCLENNREFSASEYDLRSHFKKGKLRGNLPPHIPATSGLCFSRSLLRQLLPMPEVIKISSDHYIKFAAFALSKGYLSANRLALLRIHSNNSITLRTDKKQVVARINLLTAYWTLVKFPFLSRYTNKIFASYMGNYWRVGIVDTESKKTVQNYLLSVSFMEKIEINFRALYYYIKS